MDSKVILFFFICHVAFLFACENDTNDEKPHKEVVNEVKSDFLEDSLSKESNSSKFENERTDNSIIFTDGVLLFNNSGNIYGRNDSAIIYNADLTQFLVFDFKERLIFFEGNQYPLFDFDIQLIETENCVFQPKEFNPEGGAVIKFYANRLDSTYYEVYVGDSCKKLIPSNNSNWKFKTWNEYLYGVFIWLNPKLDYQFKNLADSVIKERENTFYNVDSVNGEWVKLKCAEIYTEDCTGVSSFWVKWRDGKKLLIKI